MMKNTRKLLRPQRFMAALLCVCMIMSMFSGYKPAVRAWAAEDNVTQGAKREADPSTMDTYETVLNFKDNTRYAGRLWSDKTVFAYGGNDTGDRSSEWDGKTLTLTPELDGVAGNKQIKLDADFLHVYSVLGSSLRVDEPVPADLVLALDISGSMNSPEANEDEKWINTVDPTKENTFSTGLGFYKGSEDTSITGLVTTAQTGYEGYRKDDNGIPDAIVPVLPENGKINDVNGQMHKTALTDYNKYLTFCNVLATALKSADGGGGTISSTNAISDALKDKQSYQPDDKINGISLENYNKIYKAYLNYKNEADKATGDPWQSYNTEGNVRNALWPYADWEKAVKEALDIEATPANPMKNAGNAPNRMYYMIEAANDFIDKYLSLNSKNRISVVVYDSVATVLMPLAHYTKDGENDYLSAKKHHWQTWGEGQWACTVTATAKPNGGYDNDTFAKNPLTNGVYNASVTSWSNTGTVIALNAGLDILAQSKNSYGDLANRLPIMILMTDGAANVALTGLNEKDTLKNGDLIAAWTKGSESTTTTENGADVFNGYDGMVLTNSGSTYDKLTKENAFKNGTSSGLTVYGAKDGHIYGSESHAKTRYTVVLNTLMSTAYQKSLVEKHYNENNQYSNEADVNGEWTKANIYTIGFGLNYYDKSTKGICEEVLDPTSNFNEEHKDEVENKDGEIAEKDEDEKNFKAAFEDMFDGYTKWYENKDDGSYTQALNKDKGNSSITGDEIPALALNFPITQNDLTGTDVTKDDINRNIKYNKKYEEAVLTKDASPNEKTLEGVFTDILAEISNELFTPVAGSNDLGVENAVTYMDPIGKYMEVKDVKNMLLFGDLYGVTKTAIYDYSFNDGYQKGNGTFTNGWYRTKEDGTIEFYPDEPNWGNAWKDGWEYHVNSDTAQDFLPTEAEIDFKNPTDKIKNTTYTFYRLDMDDTSRKETCMNPAYGEEVPKNLNETDPNAENYYTRVPGVYKLSDLRIWVEDTGNYSEEKLESSGLNTDTNFDQALYVNLPVNMLPMRTVVVSPDKNVGYTYKTNLEEDTAGYSASFPLRVFYTVGVEQSVLGGDRSINVGGISAEYRNENSADTDVAKGDEGRGISGLEFFSSWYNPLNRYKAYAVNKNDYTYGDSAVTFSPDADNRYYAFEKPLTVYSEIYEYTNEGWEYVEADPDTFDSTGFGKKLLAVDLDPANETSEGIKAALSAKGITTPQEGDLVLLKNDWIKDTWGIKRHNDPEENFTAEHYYFLALEYFELDDADKSAKKIQHAVARKGGEFGSAYTATGLKNGDLLCWYDASEKNPDTYPYLSFSETGVRNRGKDHIGYKDIYRDGKLVEDVKDFTSTEQNAAKPIQEAGEWVLAAKKGGLRVGDLAKDVQRKGKGSTEYNKDFIAERYPEYKDNLTWRYYDENTTRTSNSYYLPTISTVASSTGQTGAAAAIVNTYLGNNGRLWISVPNLLLTKTVVVEGEKPESVDGTEFDFKVEIKGFTGSKDASVVRYNAATDSWQPQLHYIDLELDSKGFLQTKNSQKAMVDEDGKFVTGTASDGYTYVDDGEKYEGIVYYVYIGKTTTPESAGNVVARVYHNNMVHQDDKANEYVIPSEEITVKYYDKGGNEVNDDQNANYSGKCEFSAVKVSLVSVNDYNSFSSPQVGAKELKNFELLTVEPVGTDPAKMVIKSRYRTDSAYWTNTLNFGNDDNTADAKLKNGYGLLFSGMETPVDYSFTETLSDKEIDRGYSFYHIIQNNGDPYKPNGTRAENGDGYTYSVEGTIEDTDAEQSVHYFNRWSADKSETQINGNDVETPEDGSNTYPGVQVGDTITYQIKWANNTGKEAEVTITDRLDDGVDFEEASAPGTYNSGTRTVTWDLGNQPAGASDTVTLTVKVNEHASEYWDYDQDGVPDDPVDEDDFLVRNRATVRVAENTYNTNKVVNPLGRPSKTETLIKRDDEETVYVGKDEGNLVEKEDGKLHGPQVNVGDQITYEVEWQNYRNDEADVIIRDPLDKNVKFISASYDPTDTKDKDGNSPTEPAAADIDSENPNSGPISYNEADHKITWTLPNQPAGAKGKVTLVVKVKKSALEVGYVDNTAYVQINNEPEQETETIENPTPKQEKEEVAPGEGELVKPGDVIEYKINWFNSHEDSADITITDKLDPGVDFLDAFIEKIATEFVTNKKAPETPSPAEEQPGDGSGAASPEGPGEGSNPDGDPDQPGGDTETTTPGEGNGNEGNGTDPDSDPNGGSDDDDSTGSQKEDAEGSKTETDPEGEPDSSADDSNDADSEGSEKEDAAGSETDSEGKPDAPADDSNEAAKETRSTSAPKGSMISLASGLKSASYTVSPLTRGTRSISAPKGSMILLANQPEDAPANDAEESKNEETPTSVLEKPSEDGTDDNPSDTTSADSEKKDTEESGNKENEDQAASDAKPDPLPDSTGNAPDDTKPEEPKDEEKPDSPETPKEPEDPDSSKTPEEPTSDTETKPDAASPENFVKAGVGENGDDVTISYDKASHMVTWVLKNRPAYSIGTVSLKVRVNENAEKFWSYDNPDAPPSENQDDNLVRNQAGVKVGTDPEVKTRVIVNPTKTGDLMVSKTVTGATGDKNKTWHFTVELDDPDIYGLYGEMTFTDGIAKFTLKHGDSKTATGLPAGIGYKVTEEEADQDGYETTAEGETGTVPEGDTATARFVNSKDNPPPPESKPGNLRVTKTVTSGDRNRNWNFRVKLSDTSINGQYGDMTFTGGVAEFTLKHGESKTATGLPAGITYEVTETDANRAGYVTTIQGRTGTIPEGDTATAAFVNSKDRTPPTPSDRDDDGNLQVTKVVAGTAADKEKEWHFRVELSTSIYGQYGDMRFSGSVAEFTLKHGETKKATGLPAGTTYKVIEEERNKNGFTTTSVGDEGTIPNGGTATARFVNSNPSAPSGNPNTGR